MPLLKNKVGDSRLQSMVSLGNGFMRSNKFFSRTTMTTMTDSQDDMNLGSDVNASMQSLKMIAVFVAPVLAFVAITSVRVYSSIDSSNFVDRALQSVDHFRDISFFVKLLCTERTLVVTLLASSWKNFEVNGRLFYLTQQVDDQLKDQKPYLMSFSDHRKDLTASLNVWEGARQCVENPCNKTAQDVRDDYTSLIRNVIDIGISQTTMPQQSKVNDIWTQFVAAATLIKIYEIASNKQSFLTETLTICEMNKQDSYIYQELGGHESSMFNMLNNYSPQTNKKYVNLVQTTQGLGEERDMISGCTNGSDYENVLAVTDLLEDTDQHLAIIDGLQEEVLGIVEKRLRNKKQASDKAAAGYCTALVVVFSMCIFVSIWYARSITDMLLRIQGMTADIVSKSRLLKKEKRRTEYLLLQMLPEKVAYQLAGGTTPSPEPFDSVTVYFSDISGFEDISSRSSPHQLVDMLNNLYRIFDEAIERYNVYKVETIRDSYMVVSGLPNKCITHAAEIAHLAMELLLAVDEFEVSHMMEFRLKLRIGACSGSCVAGVVGLKMPRYCLFGDTVNTASRMETNGVPEKIHLSHSVFEELEKHGGGFVTECRGEINIKGKGNMQTHWLLGCEHTPAFHNLTLQEYKSLHTDRSLGLPSN